MFIEDRFPEDIQYGATGGPGFSTDIVQISNGNEKRNGLWSKARYSYDVSHGVKTQAQLDDLIDFFYLAMGKLNAFRFKDWSDYEVRQAQSLVKKNTDATFDIYKTYKFRNNAQYERRLLKPVVSSFLLYRNGVLTGANMDYTKGTFTLNQPIATYSVFTTSVVTNGQLSLGIPSATAANFTVGDTIQVTGFTGTGATTLNGNTYTVIQKLSATVIVISVPDVAYALNGGTVYKYDEQTDVFTFECEFDVPCRFDTDTLPAQISNFNSFTWGNIAILEVKNL